MTFTTYIALDHGSLDRVLRDGSHTRYFSVTQGNGASEPLENLHQRHYNFWARIGELPETFSLWIGATSIFLAVLGALVGSVIMTPICMFVSFWAFVSMIYFHGSVYAYGSRIRVFVRERAFKSTLAVLENSRVSVSGQVPLEEQRSCRS